MRQSILVASVFILCAAVFAKNVHNPSKWEDDIQAFEQSAREKSITQVDVLFIGSSSIRNWKIDKWFPELKALNHGFGGSHIEDSVYYFDRIVTPHQPRVIVLYAGDNDINYGKSPQRVFHDFKQFVQQMKEKTPSAKLIYIAIKPSISRWKLIRKIRAANHWVHQYCMSEPRLEFFNIDPPMIGPDGKPRPEIFVDDGLHLNETGYELWSSMLYPKIEQQLGVR